MKTEWGYCDVGTCQITNAHNLYKITSEIQTRIFAHALATNRQHQGHINTKGYKINKNNLHIPC